MNYLGQTRAACATGLRDYHRVVRRLRQSIAKCPEPGVVHGQLERLRFEVEVDVLSRTGARATDRMTDIEAAVFYPTLVGLNRTLAGLATSADPATWQEPLHAALGGLRHAVHRLRNQPQLSESQDGEAQ